MSLVVARVVGGVVNCVGPPHLVVWGPLVFGCVAVVSYSPTPSQVQYHRRCGA